MLLGVPLLIVIELAVEAVTSDDAYYQDRLWPIALGSLLMAVALSVLVDRWETPQRHRSPRPSPAPPPASLITRAGSPIARPPFGRLGRLTAVHRRGVPSSGSFMFVRLRWWRWILVTTAAVLFVADIAGQ